MKSVYSTHTAVVPATSQSTSTTAAAAATTTHRSHHHRHPSSTGGGGGRLSPFEPIDFKTTAPPPSPHFDGIDLHFEGVEEEERRQQDETSSETKDYAPPTANSSVCTASVDETDSVQHRFNRGPPPYSSLWGAFAGERDDGGSISAVSSAAPSTVSSPLSTPTRLSPHFHHSEQRCCHKTAAAAATSDAAASTDDVSVDGMTSQDDVLHRQHLHHHHLHHHHHHQHDAPAGGTGAADATNGGNGGGGGGGQGQGAPKKAQKFDPRLGPSPYRQLLPIVLCMLSFATVFSILIVYMDTTEIRHQQFRLIMSRDADLKDVDQDNPKLIAYLSEWQMRKYRRETPSPAYPPGHYNFTGAEHKDLAPKMAHYVASLFGGKTNGAVIQSMPGPLGQLMTGPWLAETLDWAGVIIEPEPRRYFTLRKQNAYRPRLQVINACVSPKSYPKEVPIHNEETEVRINSLFDEETSCFNSRVICFPLYTIMLACKRVDYELLSLGVHGQELEILQTLPFDKIRIEVISIHLSEDQEDAGAYIQSITKFLMGKSYRLQTSFERNFFYQRLNTTYRTRKKDILLLKTP